MENFDPVAYRNQFKPGGTGLASVAQPAPFEATMLDESSPAYVKPGTLQPAVHPGQKDLMNNASSGGQQTPSFYRQPMMPYGMMGGFNPMSMFMNPYGGGLGGMAYNFMNSPMPLYGQGGQFQAGEYKAPEPIEPTQPSFGFNPYGGFSFY